MKIIAAAAAATLLCGTAFAQTTTPAPSAGTAAETPAAGAGAGGTAGSAIVTLPAASSGGAPTQFLADDLDDQDVYGANDEDIGEIEDFVFSADGSIAAVVVEVGGFLGVGEKDVLVDWNAMEVTVQGNDLRILAPALTREELESAEGIDLDTLRIDD